MLERFTWFKQSAYRFDGEGLTVYIDPWGVPDGPPPADVVFITHAHYDHYSQDELAKIHKDDTAFVAPRDVAAELSGDVQAVAPGDVVEAAGIKAQVMPAYNIVEDRLEAHPKANGWVGYLLELDGRTYYHAGDTDHLPELESVKASVTFLPIGGSGFTMDVPDAAGLAKAIAPEVAVPMHYGGFVAGCGSPQDGEAFRDAASPVKVELLTPQVPFGEE
jgi:L-ascorbate metabolism protein UlaG (beta-lactamase superfamily)